MGSTSSTVPGGVVEVESFRVASLTLVTDNDRVLQVTTTFAKEYLRHT